MTGRNGRALSVEARRLIDGAIKRGDVTVLPPGRSAAGRSATKKQRAVDLAPHHTVREISERIDSSPAAVYAALRAAGVKARPGRRGPRTAGGDPVKQKRERRAAEGAAKIADRRRFKTTAVPFGEPAKLAPADSRGTIFPTRVFEPTTAEPVLKDGSSNSKIGGDVLAGWLMGARIVTLTLEERATCPRTCLLWEGCYGNAMQYARRWAHGPELETRIAAEVADLIAAHGRILVRLHVLGDFYSLAYVQMWGALMAAHAGLAVFGFTAHSETSEIGAAVADLRNKHGRRWSIRTSGRTGAWGSFTIDFPTGRKRIGDALVCPEQRDAMEGGSKGVHCGNCCACWSCAAPIAFVEH